MVMGPTARRVLRFIGRASECVLDIETNNKRNQTAAPLFHVVNSGVESILVTV